MMLFNRGDKNKSPTDSDQDKPEPKLDAGAVVPTETPNDTSPNDDIKGGETLSNPQDDLVILEPPSKESSTHGSTDAGEEGDETRRRRNQRRISVSSSSRRSISASRRGGLNSRSSSASSLHVRSSGPPSRSSSRRRGLNSRSSSASGRNSSRNSSRGPSSRRNSSRNLVAATAKKQQQIEMQRQLNAKLAPLAGPVAPFPTVMITASGLEPNTSTRDLMMTRQSSSDARRGNNNTISSRGRRSSLADLSDSKATDDNKHMQRSASNPGLASPKLKSESNTGAKPDLSSWAKQFQVVIRRPADVVAQDDEAEDDPLQRRSELIPRPTHALQDDDEDDLPPQRKSDSALLLAKKMDKDSANGAKQRISEPTARPGKKKKIRKSTDSFSSTRMLAIQDMPGNEVCADCPAPKPAWASFLKKKKHEDYKMAVLCCRKCAQRHYYKLGEKRCKIKYIKMAHEWTERNFEVLERSGNAAVNEIFEATLTDQRFCKSLVLDNHKQEKKRRSKFIKKKYKMKNYVAKEEGQQPTTEESGTAEADPIRRLEKRESVRRRQSARRISAEAKDPPLQPCNTSPATAGGSSSSLRSESLTRWGDSARNLRERHAKRASSRDLLLVPNNNKKGAVNPPPFGRSNTSPALIKLVQASNNKQQEAVSTTMNAAGMTKSASSPSLTQSRYSRSKRLAVEAQEKQQNSSKDSNKKKSLSLHNRSSSLNTISSSSTNNRNENNNKPSQTLSRKKKSNSHGSLSTLAKSPARQYLPTALQLEPTKRASKKALKLQELRENWSNVTNNPLVSVQ